MKKFDKGFCYNDKEAENLLKGSATIGIKNW